MAEKLPESEPMRPSFREWCRLVIFEADTPAGKAFDVSLIVCILLSVVAVMLASIESFMDRYGHILTALEWAFTLLFTFEYLVRIWSVRNPWLYMRSFYGLVDLAAILPTYLSLMLINAEYLIVVRLLRVMRVFRILKLIQYLESSRTIMKALRASRPQDHRLHVRRHGPRGHHWFADVHHRRTGEWVYQYPSEHVLGSGHTHDRGIRRYRPQTAVGKSLAAIVMIIGYAIIASTTGIVTAELTKEDRSTTTRSCPNCSAESHQDAARHCYRCGQSLEGSPL